MYVCVCVSLFWYYFVYILQQLVFINRRSTANVFRGFSFWFLCSFTQNKHAIIIHSPLFFKKKIFFFSYLFFIVLGGILPRLTMITPLMLNTMRNEPRYVRHMSTSIGVVARMVLSRLLVIYTLININIMYSVIL